MPLPVAHSLVACSIGVLWRGRTLRTADWATALWWSVLAVSPDFDFAVALVAGEPILHRSATHSLLTALAVGLVLAAVESRSFNWRLSAFYTLLLGSHGVLDYATTSSHYAGPALLWPVSRERFALGLWSVPDLHWLGLPQQPWVPSGFIQGFVLEVLVFLPIFLLISLAVAYLRPKLATDAP